MRMHIDLDPELIAEVDRISGLRGRSAFVRLAIETAVEQAKRWELLEQAAGALDSSAHDWDNDPAGWVREQRRGDARRVG